MPSCFQWPGCVGFAAADGAFVKRMAGLPTLGFVCIFTTGLPETTVAGAAALQKTKQVKFRVWKAVRL